MAVGGQAGQQMATDETGAAEDHELERGHGGEAGSRGVGQEKVRRVGDVAATVRPSRRSLTGTALPSSRQS